MKIKINRLQMKYDFNEVCQEYNFYKLVVDSSDEKRAPKLYSSTMTDTNNESILSICYYYQFAMYIMTDKKIDNVHKLRRIFEEKNSRDELDYVRFCKVTRTGDDQKHEVIPEYVFCQLLFNALAKYNDDLGMSNVTGRLYRVVHNPQKQLICLEFKVSKHMDYSLNVATFTELKCFENDEEAKKLPRYKYQSGKKYLTRSFSANNKTTEYIKKTWPNKRNTLKFINIGNAYGDSKIYYLTKLMDGFRRKYANLVEISEIEIESEQVLEEDFIKEKHSFLTENVGNLDIRLVNLTSDEKKMEICHKGFEALIADKGKSYSALKVEVDKKVQGKHDFICLIHNKGYYEERKLHDPYSDYGNKLVQHITLEDFFPDIKEKKEEIQENPELSDKDKKKKKKEICLAPYKSIVNELLIRKDLQLGRINLYDWNADKEYVFALPFFKKDDLRPYICLMKIKTDGTFTFEVKDRQIHTMSIFDRMFKEIKTKNKEERLATVSGISLVTEGSFDVPDSVNYIKETDNFIVPDYAGIIQECKTKPKDAKYAPIRSRECKEKYFAGLTDINYFTIDGEFCYTVGVENTNFPASFATAIKARKVIVEQGENIIPKILRTMGVRFVRNERFTVVPFPFKYLREYIKTEIADVDEEYTYWM